MSKTENLIIVRALFAGRCDECSSDRIVMYATKDLCDNLQVAKCIDCGCFGVFADNKELENNLVYFFNLLEKMDGVNYSVSDEIIDFYFKAKGVQVKNV